MCGKCGRCGVKRWLRSGCECERLGYGGRRGSGREWRIGRSRRLREGLRCELSWLKSEDGWWRV